MFFLCFCFLNLENLFFLSYKISKEEAVNFKVFLIEPICQIESIHASFSLTSSLWEVVNLVKFLSYLPFLRPLFPGTILLSLKKVVSVRKENKQLQSCQEDDCTSIRSSGVFFGCSVRDVGVWL